MADRTAQTERRRPALSRAPASHRTGSAPTCSRPWRAPASLARRASRRHGRAPSFARKADPRGAHARLPRPVRRNGGASPHPLDALVLPRVMQTQWAEPGLACAKDDKRARGPRRWTRRERCALQRCRCRLSLCRGGRRGECRRRHWQRSSGSGETPAVPRARVTGPSTHELHARVLDCHNVSVCAGWSEEAVRPSAARPLRRPPAVARGCGAGGERPASAICRRARRSRSG